MHANFVCIIGSERLRKVIHAAEIGRYEPGIAQPFIVVVLL